MLLHVGSTFDSFLEENGIQDEVEDLAQQRGSSGRP